MSHKFDWFLESIFLIPILYSVKDIYVLYWLQQYHCYLTYKRFNIFYSMHLSPMLAWSPFACTSSWSGAATSPETWSVSNTNVIGQFKTSIIDSSRGQVACPIQTVVAPTRIIGCSITAWAVTIIAKITLAASTTVITIGKMKLWKIWKNWCNRIRGSLRVRED